jgi:hypothetical protein
MNPLDLLGREWKGGLAGLVQSAQDELLITSPFISGDGAEFVSSNCREALKKAG